jgi:hypothetical protein
LPTGARRVGGPAIVMVCGLLQSPPPAELIERTFQVYVLPM